MNSRVLALASVAFLSVSALPQEAAKPKVVKLTIRSDPREEPGQPNPFAPAASNFRGNLLTLRKLAGDPGIAGVHLHVDGVPDFARALDLLAELRNVEAAGKKIVCYAEVLGQSELMFASLADELVLPPSGMVALEGLQAEVMYLKDLLDKVNVHFEILHVGEFKTAFEQLGRNTMSEQERLTIQALLDEFYGEMLDVIAANRGLAREMVEAQFEKILLTPAEAESAGLIDAVAYQDQFDERIEAVFGGEIELVEDYGEEDAEDLQKMLENPFAMFALLPKLLDPQPPEAPDEPHVAIVYASGPITSGKSSADFSGNVASMGSETIVEALDTAAEDEHVKAVVLRVNSPGGSALASDMIWRAVQRCREKGKPVVASMGNVAASGGYWISMGCDAIVAQPSTITGSIGVVSMLPDLSTVMKNIGVNVEVVAQGPHGDQLSLMKNGPTPLLREVITKSMTIVYGEFIEKVSTGRRLSPDQVQALAKGRVWTGRQAEENGLVDQLGGLDDAVALACVLGGGLDPATTKVAEYPHAPNFFEQFEDQMEGMTSVRGKLLALARELGCAELARSALAALEADSALDPARIQCLVPFSIRIR